MSVLTEKIIHKAGATLRGVTLNVDLLNACCLTCGTCSVGSIGTKRKGIMSIDTFRRVLDKAQKEMKIRHVRLYVYSDPCMHRDLHLFVRECTERGLKSWLSTMLQVTSCDFEKVIDARPTEFRISFPGLEQMSYYQSHGADPERFRRKLEEVSPLPRHPETVWTLFFHSYKDNSHEIAVAEALAKQHNLKPVVIPAIFMVLEKYVEKTYTEADKQMISRLWETPEEAMSTMKKNKTCRLWYKEITLDANADVFLCQLIYEERFKIGHYLNMPREQIVKLLETHPFCGGCLEIGGDTYQECYSPPATSANPSLEANQKRRI